MWVALNGVHHFGSGWLQKWCTAAGFRGCPPGSHPAQRAGEDGETRETKAGVAHGGLAGQGSGVHEGMKVLAHL